MKCLHRYWLKEFFKFFVIIQVMVLVLFIFIDYLSRMDKFLEFQIGLDRGLWYVLLKTPFMFMQLTPASLLLAVIVSFGIMNRHMELTALKSSGISVYFLVKPALAVGGILAALMFLLGETLIPITMANANYIRYQELSGTAKLSKGRTDIWIKSGPTLIHINFYDPVTQTVEGISCTTMGDGFNIALRMDARKGYYDNGEWVFQDVIRQVYDTASKEYLVTALPEVRQILEIEPEALGQVSRKTDEMSFTELRSYVKKVADEGYDATTYTVDMHGKLAFPFICVIMSLTGAATGMRRFVRTNLPAAVALGLVICLFYWFVFGFCMSLGYAKILPPLVAAWTANVICLCLGGIYLINTE